MTNNRGSLAPVIAAAFPRFATKMLEIHLGCTRRQAQRIAETGRAPGYLKSALRNVLLAAIEANNRVLEQHIRELRVGDHEEMLARAADRRASRDRASTDEVT